MAAIRVEQRAFIDEVRAALAPLLTKKYDTDFNILRWGIAFDYNKDKTVYKLGKHLKARKRMGLDDIEHSGLEFDPIAAEYLPLSILGRNRTDGDRLVVVDFGGRADIGGVMKSIQMTPYLNQRHRFMEKIMDEVVAIEKETGKMSGVIYIFDLEGLSFDASLVSVVTGPFRLTWTTMANHYREWIDKFVIINAPSFLNLLYAALSPFIPDKFKSRVVFTSSKWQEELLEMIDADHLPVHYGGTMKDPDGDELCRSVLKVPGKVPKDLYWKPKEGDPKIDDMTSLSVSAAGQCVLGYEITAPDTVMEFFLYNEHECSFGIYFTTDPEKVTDIKKMEQVHMEITRAGLTTIDHFKFVCDRPGAYFVKFGNEGAWLMSVSVKYEIRFFDANGAKLQPKELHKMSTSSSWWFG
uniref:CRAL-TRIO domain-containing protein n=1 Tax=Plectus sambesii TaxID=2011161 RepID=A0A914WG54_9BILA